MSFSFPIRAHQDPSRFDRVTYGYTDGSLTMSAMVRAEAGKPAVMVGVKRVADRLVAKAECNPARFYDPDGCELLPPALVTAAASVMWAAACELVKPDVKATEAVVRRLDVARDFRGLTNPALYVQGLRNLRRPYARRSFTYHDPQRANAETLFVGSGAGGVRLYDQHAAYAEKGAPEGSLRFEVEARGGWLERAGVRTLAGLDAVDIEGIAKQKWAWSKMGSNVTGPVNAVQVLQREVAAGELKQAVADRILGAMVRQSFGYGRQNRVTEWRHRELVDRLGLTSEHLWSDDLSRQAVGRLDFETGTEFLALTA